MHEITAHLFNLPIPLLEKIVRPIVVYVFLVLLLRVFGKRELAQLNPFDLVVLLSLSNTVQNAIIGDDNTVAGGLIGAFTLLFVNYLVVRFALRLGWFGRRVIGTPTLLVHDGKLITEHCRQEGVTEDEVLQALREHGVDELAEVKSAVLEVDGTISVVPMGAQL